MCAAAELLDQINLISLHTNSNAIHLYLITVIAFYINNQFDSSLSLSLSFQFLIFILSFLLRWALPLICIGAIFEQGTDEVQSAFKFAMLNHNLNVTARRFELQAYVDVINTADAFKLSRLSK